MPQNGTKWEWACSRTWILYPALLSHVATAFCEHIQLCDHVKDGLMYKDCFDGCEAFDKIAYIIKIAYVIKTATALLLS
jgi:hypothetical protein